MPDMWSLFQNTSFWITVMLLNKVHIQSCEAASRQVLLFSVLFRRFTLLKLVISLHWLPRKLNFHGLPAGFRNSHFIIKSICLEKLTLFTTVTPRWVGNTSLHMVYLDIKRSASSVFLFKLFALMCRREYLPFSAFLNYFQTSSADLLVFSEIETVCSSNWRWKYRGLEALCCSICLDSKIEQGTNEKKTVTNISIIDLNFYCQQKPLR